MLSPELHKAKTAHNREHSAKFLLDMGYSFASKNNGAHLVVTVAVGIVDFWPGTGLWEHRETRQRGRGVFNLVKNHKPKPDTPTPAGAGLVIKRTPWMSDFAVQVYLDAGFTVVD